MLGSASPADAAPAAVSSLKPEELSSFRKCPATIQSVITYSLSLTSRNLTYTFGSEDPAAGGLDCSGTVYHVLRKHGVTAVPRQSNEIHAWATTSGYFTKVTGTPGPDDPSLRFLRPGDLLFWSGTYQSGRAEGSVTHVMIYLGKTTDGLPVMFGASDGRPFRGKRRNGVSVFDFRIPKAEGRARFVGYGPVPGWDISKIPPDPPAAAAPDKPAKPEKSTAPEKPAKSGSVKKPDKPGATPGKSAPPKKSAAPSKKHK